MYIYIYYNIISARIYQVTDLAYTCANIETDW